MRPTIFRNQLIHKTASIGVHGNGKQYFAGPGRRCVVLGTIELVLLLLFDGGNRVLTVKAAIMYHTVQNLDVSLRLANGVQKTICPDHESST